MQITKVDDAYRAKFNRIEDFGPERFRLMNKGNPISGPQHSHPDEEYIEPYTSQWVIVDYVILPEKRQIGKLTATSVDGGIEISAGVPHQVHLMGPAKIFTTERNLTNAKIINNLRDCLEGF